MMKRPRAATAAEASDAITFAAFLATASESLNISIFIKGRFNQSRPAVQMAISLMTFSAMAFRFGSVGSGIFVNSFQFHQSVVVRCGYLNLKQG
jgi:hypothetical protein